MSYTKKLRKSIISQENTTPHVLLMGDANSTYVKEHIEYTLLTKTDTLTNADLHYWQNYLVEYFKDKNVWRQKAK